MGISLSTALEGSKSNCGNDNAIYELHLLERKVLRKLEEQASKLYLTALNDECLPIVCAVDKRQKIVIKIDAASDKKLIVIKNEVRQSLNEILRGNYLEELVNLLTEKLSKVLKTAITGDEERSFTYVVFANKSILRLDFFVYYRSFSPNESVKDYNNILAYFIQVGLLDILKSRPQVLNYELIRTTEEDKVNDACEKLLARAKCTGRLGYTVQYMGKIPGGEIHFSDQHCALHKGAVDRTREIDRNDHLMSAAVGTIAPTSIGFGEDSQQHFPIMNWEEMLTVATDLQGSGRSVELSDSPATLRLDENHGSSSVAAPTVVQVNTAQKLGLTRWSISGIYNSTWQYLSERFGVGTKTVDTELKEQIFLLKETRIKYTDLLKLAKEMMQHFQGMNDSQRDLADAFANLGMTESPPKLQCELNENAETQRSLVKNGELLLGALSFFISNLTTLVHTTIEDSIVTVKAYESARLEYDAYRTDLESKLAEPVTADNAKGAKHKHDIHKEKFDKLRTTLRTKLRFLEQNKVKVMQKQLLLFQNATSAYFSRDKRALDNCVKTFHIKITSSEAKQE